MLNSQRRRVVRVESMMRLGGCEGEKGGDETLVLRIAAGCKQSTCFDRGGLLWGFLTGTPVSLSQAMGYTWGNLQWFDDVGRGLSILQPFL